MKNKLAVTLCVLTNFTCGQNIPENSDTAITDTKGSLTVKFNNPGSIVFNYLDKNQINSTLEFKNPTHTDTLVHYSITSDKPLHLYAANAHFTPDRTEPVVTYKTLFLMPGDSIIIDQNKQQVVYSRYGVEYIDSLIDTRNFYDKNLPVTIKSLKVNGLKYLVTQIQQQYEAVDKKINELPQNNNDQYQEALHTLNFIRKLKKITDIPLDAKPLPASDKRLLDSIYKDIETNYTRFSSINTPFSYQIVHSLISYNALKQGKLTGNFWDYFNTAGATIIQSNLYRSFLLNYMHADFYSNKRLDNLAKLITKVKNAGIKDARFDSLLQAKTALKKELAKVTYTMLRPNGDKLEYAGLLASLKGSYVFVDFWASWCGPCRREMPYLRALKPELENKNIKFVSISIDNDDQIDDWRAASKDEGLHMDELNFRLQKGNRNLLLKTLEISSVPRYFLYDPNGNLISGNFITPDKKEFKELLLKEISKKN